MYIHTRDSRVQSDSLRDRAERLGEPLPAPPTADCGAPIILDRFQTGDYRLRPHHFAPLQGAAFLIKQILSQTGQLGGSGVIVGARVRVEGYTDSSGQDTMNQGLSLSRASEARNFLTDLEVPRQVFQLIPRGKASPRASNGTETGRRKNRRVEIKVCALVAPLSSFSQGPI